MELKDKELLQKYLDLELTPEQIHFLEVDYNNLVDNYLEICGGKCEHIFENCVYFSYDKGCFLKTK